MSPRFNLEDYETVESRLEKFWAANPGARVTTDLIWHADGQQFIVKAYLFRDGDDVAFATGLAEETVGTSPVNRTAALENCETSAIGRALANAGYATHGKRPSREEMTKVADRDDDEIGSEGARPQRHMKSVAGGASDDTRLATEKQVYMVRAKLRAAGFPDELPDGWTEAGLPDNFDAFPFGAVNRALAFVDQLTKAKA